VKKSEKMEKSMKEVYEKLKELQKVLLKEFDIEADIEEIPRELNDLKRQFARVDRNIKENEIANIRYSDRIKEMHTEKEYLLKNKEKYEGQISLIKTQKEYEAITSEIAQINEKLEKIEEELEEAVQQIDNLEKMLQEQKETYNELKKIIEEKEKEVKNQITLKQKELEKCLKEKQNISFGLDEEVIYKFEKIVKKKEGVGIVSIRNNVCMGCNMILPPQFVNDVRSEKEIIFCPNCTRILYYQEEEHPSEEIVV